MDLLARTSRTFALAIPCLPDPLRHEVTVAYLLFRIADTIEDGPHLNRGEKLSALEDLDGILLGKWGKASRMLLPRSPCDNADYLDLLDALPLVLDQAAAFPPAIRLVIVRSVRESMSGMRQFIAAGSPAGRIELHSLTSLRQYCYFVAGIVGEMLTDLFIQANPSLESVAPTLHQQARFFGEGLQIVNILKDSSDDQRVGNKFVPAGTSRTQLFDLARDGLRRAEEYVGALQQAKTPAGVLAFTQLPLRLAWRTLECVERSGPGSKVPRGEVLRILAEAQVATGLRPMDVSAANCVSSTEGILGKVAAKCHD